MVCAQRLVGRLFTRVLTRPFTRALRFLLVGLVALALSIAPPLLNVKATEAFQQQPMTSKGLIPIEDQPFYPLLLKSSETWSDVVLDQVVGDSPRTTLLNFYSVMADVGLRADRLGQRSSAKEQSRQEQIDDTNLLFALAVKALDSSSIPKSVRDDMADEAAIQLKHVLDYVFTHSRQLIEVPDVEGMKELNDRRSTPTNSWRIPGTAVTLTSDLDDDPENESFYFSASTVSSIRSMYDEIRTIPEIQQPFATPRFYSDFIHTPGYLVPPDWYLALPKSWRGLFEWPIGDQTLFQVFCAALLIGVYGFIYLRLLRMLFNTYKSGTHRVENDRLIFQLDSLAWKRVLIVLPALPLTYATEQLIDNFLNFTGFPLVVAIYSFYVIWYFSASVLVFFLFEAVGRSSSEFLARVRGGESPIRLRRITSLVMPISRVVGALVSVVLIYRLLLLLGLPSSTVLAFSAVPGLAIGLGASKLLGNLFAGLSIQTDRPLRVGEFCEVGGNLGFVTKIGLRSMELQTLESRVTIPNSVADEATIVNYSRRGVSWERQPVQGLELRLPIRDPLSPFQLDELMRQARRMVAAPETLQLEVELYEPVVSLESLEDGTNQLIVFVMVELHGWTAFLKVRETLLVALEELLERVSLSELVVGVAYSTTPQQLERIPELMRSVVAEDSQLDFEACRLVRISAFSYDHELEIRSCHAMHDDFENSLHRLNRRILEVLSQHRIEIPFPTQTLELHSSESSQ
ncbi:mechanosensitive ion channel family protein [Synechococcus sp. GEYO]|uniref:mechanosensitive ion channel family protein n=1 Tax=Synechococcus sp. GEYO TaxID=2575511 RepID=UPI00148335E6|nr:mechanosensitive ion channel family protein [Synechococcus sp. GEYO]